MAEVTSDFELLSTLHANLTTGNEHIYMCDYHHERLLLAAKHFGWIEAVKVLQDMSLEKRLIAQIDSYLQNGKGESASKFLKLRILVNRTGCITVRIDSATNFVHIPYPQQLTRGMNKVHCRSISRQEIWRIVVDTKPTLPTNFTRYKTTKRDIYNAARLRVGLDERAATETSGQGSGPVDVLMYNQATEITETSICTVYFFRNCSWVTPPVSCGSQDGTTRRWALDNGLCKEQIILLGSLTNEEEIWVSNGLRGFAPGVVEMTCAASTS